MIGQRIGKYHIVRQLGEGGMGVVYEAVREDIGGRAAMKVLRPEFAGNTEIAGRFFNEARAANLIQNPAIVQIFDYGHLPDGAAYLAMELLKGESLRARLTREEVLSESDTLWITRQVAAGLEAAHAQQVIHRDLSILSCPTRELTHFHRGNSPGMKNGAHIRWSYSWEGGAAER